MNVAAATRLTVCMCLASATIGVGVVAGETKFLPALMDIRHDENASMTYLNGLNSKELLQVCAEYGEAVEKGEEGKEGILIEIVLGVVKERGDLTQGMLLAAAADKEAPVLWRRLAIRYSSREDFIPAADIDLHASLQIYTNLLVDATVPLGLREESCAALGRILSCGYHWLLCESEGRERNVDQDQRERIRSESLDVWQRHDEFVSMFVDFATAVSTPKALQERAIPEAIRAILRERGRRTPQFEKLRAFIENQSKDETKAVSSEYRKVCRDLEGMTRQETNGRTPN